MLATDVCQDLSVPSPAISTPISISSPYFSDSSSVAGVKLRSIVLSLSSLKSSRLDSLISICDASFESAGTIRLTADSLRRFSLRFFSAASCSAFFFSSASRAAFSFSAFSFSAFSFSAFSSASCLALRSSICLVLSAICWSISASAFRFLSRVSCAFSRAFCAFFT